MGMTTPEPMYTYPEERWGRDPLECLVGRTVLAVRTYQGSQRITFEVLGSDLYLEFICDADCCSKTWIEHVNGLDALIGQPVVEVESLLMGEDKSDDRDDCVQMYESRLKTARGVFSIEFRNGSNGYYGGRLEYRGETFNEQDASEQALQEDF